MIGVFQSLIGRVWGRSGPRGSGTAAVAPLAGTGAGQTGGFSGPGSAALAPLAGSGAGLETFQGSGAGALAPLAASGTATHTLTTPNLTSLDFDVADTDAGDSITITGTNLSSASSCTVGGTSATITNNTSTTLTFTMPAKAAGSYNVQVTTAAGSSNTLSIEAWNPGQIANIDGYFDSRKGLTLSGSDVTVWTEQSRSTGYNSRASFRPTKVNSVFGANPAVRMNGSQYVADSLRLLDSGTRGASVFWVGKWTSSDNTEDVYEGNCPLTVVADSSNNIVVSWGASAGVILKKTYSGSWGQAQGGSSLNDGVTRLVGSTHDDVSNDLKFYIGATQTGGTVSPTYSSSTGWTTIGGAYSDGLTAGSPAIFTAADGFDGDLGAVIIVHAVISSGDRTKLHTWARAGFGAAA